MWLTVSYALAVILIIIVLMSWKRPPKFPPGPRGLPLIGNGLDMLSLLKNTKFNTEVWDKLSARYGPVVGIRLGVSTNMIIVNGRDAVLEVLNREEFDGRPDSYLIKMFTSGERKGIIFNDGKAWKEQRRFALKHLRDFGYGRKSMEEMILVEAISLRDLIGSRAKEGIVRDIHEIAAIAVVNSLWYLIAGKRYDQQMRDPELKEIVHILNSIFKENRPNISVTIFPFLKYVAPEWSGYKEHCERQDRMKKFFGDEVSNHKETRDPDKPRDMMDVYLNEIAEQKFNPHSSFDDMRLTAVIKDFFIAGAETTNNAIGFVLLYLMAKQDVQKKVHKELDSVLGRDTLPDALLSSRLPYLNATVSEVLRISNIAPLCAPHTPNADTTLRGYRIKKGDLVLVNLTSVHMDEAHWGDPEVFRPERFIDDKGQFFNDPWLMPFGSGRRKCVGEIMAKYTLVLFTACLLQKFKFELPPGDPEPLLKGIDGFTISPPKFNALVKVR